jgi:hypothetical protein
LRVGRSLHTERLDDREFECVPLFDRLFSARQNKNNVPQMSASVRPDRSMTEWPTSFNSEPERGLVFLGG